MALNVLQRQHRQPMQQSHKELKKPDPPLSNEMKSNGSSSTPTPVDFDKFIPWILLEMQSCATVVVKKVDKVPKETIKDPSGAEENKDDGKDSQPLSNGFKPSLECVNENAVRIMTYYDSDGYLTEISIIKRPEVPLHRLILKALALCIPFHPFLTKISISKGKLDCGIIYEITKLLPFSKLTDICLDHSHVLQGNFYILLDQQTTLKCLSLSDCNINDLVCKEIAERIEVISPASKNLRVLNLSHNEITDSGAEALGRSLRLNRHLVYLNLCNNSITSVGAAHILLPLAKFSFHIDEVLMFKDNRLCYIKKKLENAERCLKDISVTANVQEGDGRQRNRDLKPASGNPRKKRPTKEGIIDFRRALAVEAINDIALDVAAQCNDAFHPSNMFRSGDSWFSDGNLVLCCLNLGYNHLDYFSVQKLVEVLSYQQRCKTGRQRGLLRVMIEGNELPFSCTEYDLINACLKRSEEDAVPAPSQVKRRGSKERRRSEKIKNNIDGDVSTLNWTSLNSVQDRVTK